MIASLRNTSGACIAHYKPSTTPTYDPLSTKCSYSSVYFTAPTNSWCRPLRQISKSTIDRSLITFVVLVSRSDLVHQHVKLFIFVLDHCKDQLLHTWTVSFLQSTVQNILSLSIHMFYTSVLQVFESCCIRPPPCRRPARDWKTWT